MVPRRRFDGDDGTGGNGLRPGWEGCGSLREQDDEGSEGNHGISLGRGTWGTIVSRPLVLSDGRDKIAFESRERHGPLQLRDEGADRQGRLLRPRPVRQDHQPPVDPRALPIKNKGKMLSLATETDRTLFFDFLPIDLGHVRGMQMRIQLYTVPGQVFYNATRRMVLKGADAVVFVVDSQEAMLDASLESFENMRQNLEANEIDPDEIPTIFQYNKRDLRQRSPHRDPERAAEPTGLALRRGRRHQGARGRGDTEARDPGRVRDSCPNATATVPYPRSRRLHRRSCVPLLHSPNLGERIHQLHLGPGGRTPLLPLRSPHSRPRRRPPRCDRLRCLRKWMLCPHLLPLHRDLFPTRRCHSGRALPQPIPPGLPSQQRARRRPTTSSSTSWI